LDFDTDKLRQLITIREGDRLLGISKRQAFAKSPVAKAIYEAGHLRIIAAGAGLLVVATIFLTMFDRHLDPAFHKAWAPGLADSF